MYRELPENERNDLAAVILYSSATEALGMMIRAMVASKEVLSNKVLIQRLIAQLETATLPAQQAILSQTLALVVCQTPDDPGI